MKFELDHTFPFGLETYVRTMCDPGYDQYVAENVNLKAREEQSSTLDGDVLRRCVRVIPERDLPKAAARLVGGKTLAYDENLELNTKTGEGRWWVVPGVMQKRVDAKGTSIVRETADGCSRRVEGEINVRLIGAGRLIEKFIVGQVVDGYDTGARLMVEWAAKHAEK